MTKTSITKIFNFEAAHNLPNHEGNCYNLHGHSYRLEIEVTGTRIKVGPATGMILDFGDLKKIVKDYILDSHDHTCLNDLYDNPTAEVMIGFIHQTLSNALWLKHKVHLVRVRLWETATSYAEIKEEC